MNTYSAPYQRDGKWFRLHNVDSFTQVEEPCEAPVPPEAPKPAAAEPVKAKAKR